MSTKVSPKTSYLDRERISKRVRVVIQKELGLEESKVTNSAVLKTDLGMDSLDEIELVMEFEKEFNIDIPDEDMPKNTTVAHWVGYIEERLR